MNTTSLEQSVSLATMADDGSPYAPKTVTQRAIQYALLALSAITVIVNPITLTAIIKSKLVTVSSVNVAITSICFSDLLLGLTVFFLYLPTFDMEFAAYDPDLMKVRFILSVFCVMSFFASNFNGFLITLDRALATIFPLQYKTKTTTNRAVVAVVMMWLIVAIFVVIASTVQVQIFMQGEIRDMAFPNQVLPGVTIIYFTTPCLIVSMTINVSLYAAIVRSLAKSGQKVRAQNDTVSEKRNLRLTRMVVVVIGVMLIGNMPIAILAAIPVPASTSPNRHTYAIAFDISGCLSLVPTFTNNIIYVARMADFEKAVRDLFCCKRASAS